MLISDETGFTVICAGSLQFKMYIAEHAKRQVSNIKRVHHRYICSISYQTKMAKENAFIY